LRNAEFRARIICGNLDAERSANYTLFEFRIPHSANLQKIPPDGTTNAKNLQTSNLNN